MSDVDDELRKLRQSFEEALPIIRQGKALPRDLGQEVLLYLELREVKDERQERELETLRVEATIDGLTGLPNRNSVMKGLERSYSRLDRGHIGDLTLWIGDLDHFKRVNDTYGHLAGDNVLKGTAKFMLGQTRPTDMVGRYGGEEFIGFLEGANAEQTVKRLDEMQRGLGFNVASYVARESGTPIRPTMSIGVHQVSRQSKPGDLDTFLKGEISKADKALYESKENGRNRITVYRD